MIGEYDIRGRGLLQKNQGALLQRTDQPAALRPRKPTCAVSAAAKHRLQSCDFAASPFRHRHRDDCIRFVLAKTNATLARLRKIRASSAVEKSTWLGLQKITARMGRSEKIDARASERRLRLVWRARAHVVAPRQEAVAGREMESVPSRKK